MCCREHDTARFAVNGLDADEFLLLPVRRGFALKSDCASLCITIMAIVRASAQAVDVALRPFFSPKHPGLAGFGFCVMCFFHASIKSGLLLNVLNASRTGRNTQLRVQALYFVTFTIIIV